MKKMRKIMALVIAMIMMVAMSSVAFAAPDAVPTKGTITIKHAGIGETYKVYKVLEAEVGANGAIVYPGPVPKGLENLFEVVEGTGNIQVKSGVTDEALFNGLKTWAEGATATYTQVAESDVVTFDPVEFGYYVVVSTQDNGAAISVTSTNPDAVTYEKNISKPQPTKTVDDKDYSIGDTITYTVEFNGANYMGSGENAEIVTSYDVSDTLPDFLSDAHIQSIKIASNPEITITDKDFTNKKVNIPWAERNGDKWDSLYPNGTKVTITYTATLTEKVRVGADNTNIVKVTPNVDKDDNGEEEPWDESWEDEEKITTYAAAIKKIDGDGKALAGAKFVIAGLTATKGEDGVYTVTKYDPTDTTITPTPLVVDANGMIYIVGLDSELSLSIKETEAPAGYNMLTDPVTLTTTELASEIIKSSGYRKYDAKGNIVEEGTTEITGGTQVTKNLSELDAAALPIVNNKGSLLPSTGGMGTTIFYLLGGILVIGAAIMLIARRRVESEK